MLKICQLWILKMSKIAVHDSSIRHTTGQAIYIDDIPDQENLLHGGLVLSKCAYGKIKKIDFSRLKTLPFYTKIVIFHQRILQLNYIVYLHFCLHIQKLLVL